MRQRRKNGSILHVFVFKTNLLRVILKLRACRKGNFRLGPCPNVFNKTEMGPYASRRWFPNDENCEKRCLLFAPASTDASPKSTNYAMKCIILRQSRCKLRQSRRELRHDLRQSRHEMRQLRTYCVNCVTKCVNCVAKCVNSVAKCVNSVAKCR